jgi:hypothetical protein
LKNGIGMIMEIKTDFLKETAGQLKLTGIHLQPDPDRSEKIKGVHHEKKIQF